MLNNIVLICDNNYVMPTCVTIKSILNSNTSCNLVIHVCGVDLSLDSQKLLSSMDKCIQIHIINLNDYEERLREIKQYTHVSPAALIKFELPNILSNTSKVLYLDGDIIVRKDLLDLFNIDIDGYYLAASFEFWKFVESKTTNTVHESDYFYFNSGVMLLNLDEMRKHNICELLWKEKIRESKESNTIKLMDQNVLNTVCGLKTYHLPIHYNFNVVFVSYKNINDINNIYGLSYSSIKQLIDDVFIFHYVGKTDKPWKYRDAHMQNEWYISYKSAGFSEAQLELKENKRDLKYFRYRIKLLFQKYGFIGLIKYLLGRMLHKNDWI